jgi:hypothetical protein
LVGKALDVLVEGQGQIESSEDAPREGWAGRRPASTDPQPISVGRSYRDAPEIDGLVLIEGEAPVGQIVPVRITGAMTYDLTGVVETARTVIHLENLSATTGSFTTQTG